MVTKQEDHINYVMYFEIHEIIAVREMSSFRKSEGLGRLHNM